jgi:hypothetical protein
MWNPMFSLSSDAKRRHQDAVAGRWGTFLSSVGNKSSRTPSHLKAGASRMRL